VGGTGGLCTIGSVCGTVLLKEVQGMCVTEGVWVVQGEFT
jgi:hypothetical protein